MSTPQLNSSSATSHIERTPNKHLPLDSTSMVRVIARIRPFLPHEISRSNDADIDKSIPCVSVLDSPLQSASEVTVRLKDPHSCRNENYKLDSFYGQEDNNLIRIFEREVMPLIPAVLNGFNATVFAYGATGSGKTFTMQGSDELPGLMRMATSSILSMCEKIGNTVQVSYYEIYMDRCYDLLEDTPKPKEITILDDKQGNPHLRNLSKIPIYSMSDFHDVFLRGIQRRKVAHTGLNDVSSRSHGVLVISVSRSCENGALIGKLNLIDLAGNEDNRRSGNEGVRLIESQKINQSLFALSNVIYALNNKNTRIPYRESKLTRILQDSLGGTNHALMVACLNPGEYEQSVHTVSLAARSRRVSNFLHSAQKHNNNNNNNTRGTEVDMEEKLRVWLESKGKTKNDIPFTTTPRSISSTKKHITFQSSGKPKPIATLEEQVEKGLKMTPTRKVLFPINSNIIDPITPKHDSVADETDTPLNKFKAMSCNLKSTLAQEYVNFLNTANKGELLQLKGIGEKMAEYILELRDMTPLKSLNDLEKIGISSKQVGNMFGRTAKGLFD
ncbi:kinesin-like protein KIN-10B [Lactuca sativa]|uniref:Kinesin-like protein n=1 Tax=Lactuca sativa TaxID=4236 RepID=A0A9R1UDR8_LACSA|nr:kinesin-like protein KIN-10B [Lactuca sativa]KAJ0185264.1 hypothetical protein LSAT_V11C900484960 [Lactuca sativa]